MAWVIKMKFTLFSMFSSFTSFLKTASAMGDRQIFPVEIKIQSNDSQLQFHLYWEKNLRSH